MTHLTAIILTYNESKHIVDCIKSLQFADHILVYDSYSTDSTVELAQSAGAEVAQRVFDNYAGQRNAALAYVEGKTEWVLFIDADERVPDELAREILGLLGKSDYAGWRVPRHNYIFGKLTRGAGWYPDYQTRLLKVGRSRYDPDVIVHEVVQLNGELGTLRSDLIHYNYENLAHFTAKQRKYSEYDARILFENGQKIKPQNYILQPLRQFWWRFVTLKGYQDGFHGLWLSALMGWYELRKYIILRGLWKNEGK